MQCGRSVINPPKGGILLASLSVDLVVIRFTVIQLSFIVGQRSEVGKTDSIRQKSDTDGIAICEICVNIFVDVGLFIEEGVVVVVDEGGGIFSSCFFEYVSAVGFYCFITDAKFVSYFFCSIAHHD